MAQPSFIGKRISKLDAPAKVTGRSMYGHDVRLPGMLHGSICYSNQPHAKILRIDITKAQNLPGVKCILTAKDNPTTKFGYGRDNTPFKGDVVRSYQDAVAAVVGIDPWIAEKAVSLIQVEYEPLPAIFSAQEALSDGAPLIHPERGSNLYKTYDYSHGDLNQGEADSDVVVEHTFRLPYVTHACMETSVVVAEFDHQGVLTLWSTTQIPFLLQRDLSEALDLPGHRIRVVQTSIGGAFGRGLDIYPYEPIAALMARKSGAPVRLAFSRHEEFTAAPIRQPVSVKVRAGATKDGLLTFRDVDAILDVGAHISWGSVTPLVMMETTASLYQVPHVRFKADCVYTNNPTTGAMRGYGNPQSTFFIETMMDSLAAALDIDPLAFRILNANQPDTTTPQGLEITSCGLTECLRIIGAEADRKEDGLLTTGDSTAKKHDLHRGIGFAATLNVGGGARIYRSDGCGATIKVDDFGRVTLVTGSTEIGQGSETALAQIVAETLGVRLENIRVINTDTGVKPWDVGVHASRTTFIAGKAAMLAAIDAQHQIFETASEMLGVPEDKLAARNGLVFHQEDPTQAVEIEKVVRKRHFQSGGTVISGEGWYDPPTQMVDKDTYKGNISAAYGFGAQAAEVEVDSRTGKVRVLRLICANDVGRAINPMAVEGQIEGGAQMGLGYALSEEVIIEQGKILNPNFTDYRLFTSADMPEIETFIVETNDPLGPFGAKGVGEMGGTPTAAAIGNAVYNAIGIRLLELPMTPERVLRAIEMESNSETKRMENKE